MKAYPEEFRREVLAACDRNEGTRAIALRFRVWEFWVRRIQQQRRETGQVEPHLATPRQPKWRAWADWLQAKFDARPDIYLRELQAELKQELGEPTEMFAPRWRLSEIGVDRTCWCSSIRCEYAVS